MPAPRDLGNAALAIGEWINTQNLIDAQTFHEIIRLAADKNYDGIITAANIGAQRNMLQFQVGLYLVTGNFGKAQDTMIDVAIVRKANAS